MATYQIRKTPTGEYLVIGTQKAGKVLVARFVETAPDKESAAAAAGNMATLFAENRIPFQNGGSPSGIARIEE